MKRRTFIQIGLGTTVLAAVPFPVCTGAEPEDRRPENMQLDFSACPHCNQQRFEYHKYYCPTRAAIPAGEEKFYESILNKVNAIRLRHCEGLDRLVVQPERNGSRVVQVWIDGETYTWSQSVWSAAVHPSPMCHQPKSIFANSGKSVLRKCSHRSCIFACSSSSVPSEYACAERTFLAYTVLYFRFRVPATGLNGG